MSKAATSPTARLLQNSRLFSLPRPLPAPPLESLSSAGIFRASDSATTPYPTLQAITTPRSSLSRGDFGLKRALPAKTTRNTSTPHVRIRAQDTYEHVTEFASAADHTQSREKWLEMGVPIVSERQDSRDISRTGQRKVPQSVFEEHLDNTDPEARVRVRTQLFERSLSGAGAYTMEPKQRWKYTSPHIGGMQEGEFQMWLEKKITPAMRLRWREFLRQKEMQSLVAEEKRQARDEGRVFTAEEITALEKARLPTDKELEGLEKKLRDDHIEDSLSSVLSQRLTEFLDLPPLPGLDRTPAMTSALQEQVQKYVADKPPPSTHPSAGLSHLRTNAIMDNHPIFGPQKHRIPVEARVVSTRYRGTAVNVHSANLGVGGFVASDPVSATYNPGNDRNKIRSQSIPDQMATQLDPDLIGGNKMWVHPESAWIDDKGRIVMSVARADDEAIAVKKRDVKEIFEKKNASPRPAVGAWDSESVGRTRPEIQGFDIPEVGGGDNGQVDAAEMVRRALGEPNGFQT